jgi:uncharacterized protein YsxB (DUF464 family)
MIKVLITRANDTVTGVTVSGHAQSAEYGKDIVCAGVSAVTTGVANTLVNHDFLKVGTIDFKTGYVSIHSSHMTSEHQLILETLITTLENIEESYGTYIKIINQEE